MNAAAKPVDRRRRHIVAAGLGLMLPVTAFAQMRTVTDGAGRRVQIPLKVSRIYAAGPPASVLAFALAPEKLIGWTTPFRDAEKPFVAPRYAELPAYGRLTGRGNTANVEVVIKAQPDLIVDYGAVRDTFVSLADRVHAQTGIPYLLLDGDFDRMVEVIMQFGQITGEEGRAAALAKYARDTLADIAGRVAKVPPARRPRVYYARGPAGLNTGLAGSINTESIEQVGATNVAAELGRGGLVQVSIEQVLRWNPDLIVTTDAQFFQLARSHPLWRALPAVRDGRLHLAPQLPFGWIDFPPSLNRLIGLRWLARLLYPEVFSEDLRPIVRDFYSRLYHQTPSEAQLDQLLGAAVAPL
ncbi:MAG: iron ABC transporter substrate-binding protein [Betaproteobacteria bacterium]|nr:iron ABC transporter substrate-binding protein [Betaproteobacteria bacterium]